jgi:hypothetical protein
MSETQTPIAAEPDQAVYGRCEQCTAPVEERQRYCVACGSRQGRAEDPVARYLAVATSASRAAKAARPAAGRRRRTPGLATALVVAAIPLAVGVGVLVGRANSGGDAKLNAAIVALRAQKPEVVVTGGGAAVTAAAQPGATTHTVASTFPLQQGYAVELETLSAQSSASAVAKAEQAAKAKGATGVGVITAKAFTVTPKPSGAGYVLYSGEFKTKAEADAALAKLKRHFPGAVVITVHSITSGSSSSSGSGGQIGATATKAQKAQGAQAVNQISHATGSNYVNDQNNLPGQVSVP